MSVSLSRRCIVTSDFSVDTSNSSIQNASKFKQSRYIGRPTNLFDYER